MFVFAEEGIENGKDFRRSSIVQGDIRGLIQDELKRISEKGCSYTPVDEDGNIFLVTGKNTQYKMCMYETEKLTIEPYIISVFYHLRKNYFVEVMRDTPHGEVIVYLYIAGIPGGKTEIARMGMCEATGDDDNVIAAVLLLIEDRIQKFEN